MFAVPLSTILGMVGVVYDRIKGPAILGTLISGGLCLFWVLAITGVLWC
jgi:hypothetical protein